MQKLRFLHIVQCLLFTLIAKDQNIPVYRIPFNVYRIYTVLRIPYSVYRIRPHTVFRIVFRIYRIPYSVSYSVYRIPHTVFRTLYISHFGIEEGTGAEW